MSEFRIDQIKSQDASRGPDIAGITTFTGTSGIVMPSGDTAYRGGRGRGVFCGGYNPTAYNIMDYVTIATLGNAINFGDLTTSVRLGTGNGSSTRGIVSGGFPATDVIQYTTISSTGNTLDFGSISYGTAYGVMSAGNSTRNLILGGAIVAQPTNAKTIDYVTFSTLGNSTFFGDLQDHKRYGKAISSPTRAVSGSYNTAPINALEFVTIQTLGNAKDFGDLTSNQNACGGAASLTRGIFAGGHVSPADIDNIDYITFSSRGNALDFGNLTTAKHYYGSGTSSSTRGIFAAGEKYGPTSYRSEIDYITIATTGNAADFGDVTQSRGQTSDFSDSAGGLG